MKFRTLLLSLSLTAASLADGATPAIDQQFEQTVKPFVGKYCVACHSGKMAPAQFDLKSYTSVDMVADDFARWALLAERLKNQEMPPKPIPPPPAAFFISAARTAATQSMTCCASPAGGGGIGLGGISWFFSLSASSAQRAKSSLTISTLV